MDAQQQYIQYDSPMIGTMNREESIHTVACSDVWFMLRFLFFVFECARSAEEQNFLNIHPQVIVDTTSLSNLNMFSM
jgi:hypothetical protein